MNAELFLDTLAKNSKGACAIWNSSPLFFSYSLPLADTFALWSVTVAS